MHGAWVNWGPDQWTAVLVAAIGAVCSGVASIIAAWRGKQAYTAVQAHRAESAKHTEAIIKAARPGVVRPGQPVKSSAQPLAGTETDVQG